MFEKEAKKRIDSYRKLIGKNKVDEFFMVLDEDLLPLSTARDDFMLLRSQHERLKKAQMIGTIESSAALVENNKILNGINLFLGTLKEKDFKSLPAQDEVAEEPQKPKKTLEKAIILFLLVLILFGIYFFLTKREDNCNLEQAGIYLKYDMKKCEKIDEDKIIVISLSTGKVQKSGFFYEKSAFLNRKRYAYMDLKKCTPLSIENTSYHCESK